MSPPCSRDSVFANFATAQLVLVEPCGGAVGVPAQPSTIVVAFYALEQVSSSRRPGGRLLSAKATACTHQSHLVSFL